MIQSSGMKNLNICNKRSPEDLEVHSLLPFPVFFLPNYFNLSFQESEANNSNKRARKLFYESSESAQIDTLNATIDVMDRPDQIVGINLSLKDSFLESTHIGTRNEIRDISGRPDHGRDVGFLLCQIDHALRRFFKPQYGSPESPDSPPSARVVLDAMMGSSQGFQVVKRFSSLSLYNLRTPAGDPLRKYMALFRSEAVHKSRMIQ
jgi:hypothetical protein